MKTNNQIKVLVFAKHLDGGTGVFVEQMKSLRIKRRSVNIQVLALEKPQFRAASSLRVFVSYFSIKQLLPYSYVLTPNAIINTIREFRWLQNNIALHKPDFIISVDNHCNVLVCFYKLLFCKHYKLRTILTIHNNISAVTFAKLPALGRKLFQYVCRFLFRQADVIVCVSKGVASDAKKFFSLAKLPYVIHIGVNIREIQRLARHSVKPEYADMFRSNKIKIITIGRFAPQKDFETLFYAFTAFYKKHSNTELIIIGDGSEKERLISIVQDLKITRAVHFLGWQQNVYPYIQASDVFVLSSNYEGFPYVLLEAGALGKPIIATNTPFGPRDLLGDNTYGIVVPMKSSKMLAKALESLMDKNTRVHYQSQILKRVEKFSESIMLKQYQALIESLA